METREQESVSSENISRCIGIVRFKMSRCGCGCWSMRAYSALLYQRILWAQYNYYQHRKSDSTYFSYNITIISSSTYAITVFLKLCYRRCIRCIGSRRIVTMRQVRMRIIKAAYVISIDTYLSFQFQIIFFSDVRGWQDLTSKDQWRFYYRRSNDVPTENKFRNQQLKCNGTFVA